MKTPQEGVNAERIQQINQQAKSKITYAYKERFNGVYEEKKRLGQIKRENSWERFINPDHVGLNNTM